LYLLDDPLSAVDNHVAKHIYDHCINGLLANKTRILATHHLKYLLNANSILVIDDNTVITQGSPNEIIPDYMKNYKVLINSNETQDENIIENNHVSNSKPLKLDEKKSHNKEEQNLKESKNDEEKEQGLISFKVYKYYCVSIGIMLASLVFLIMIFTQGKL
jgi:ATP-binding cassette subfamily C (CFTR/MRP) protein 10